MLTLEIPFAAPTITIELRSAELGNSISLDNRQKLRQSMSGDLYTYVTTNDYEKLMMNLVNIPRTDLEAVANVLRTNGEDDWKITDHKGRVWRAIPLTTPLRFSMQSAQFIDGQGNPCEEAGTTDLEFIGVRQP